MFRIGIISVFFILTSLSLYSQGELIDEDRVITYNEKSFALLFNSNGFSGQYRYGQRIDGFRKRLYDIDFSYIKHAKEIRISNPYYDNQKRFVFGKLNSFFTLRGGFGLQKEKYSKQDKGGVSIKYYYQGGLSLGLLKPMYYEVVDSTRIDPIRQEITLYIGEKKFNSDIHSPSDIYSRSSFFKGVDELGFVPGAFVRAGVSFEYNSSYQQINAIETGIIFDIFPKSIPIMDTEKNHPYFLSLYIGYRFGRVQTKKNE